MDSNFDVCILGMGATGYETVSYCVSKGLRVGVTDSRDLPPTWIRLKSELEESRLDASKVAVSLGGFDRGMLANSKRVVISPGIKPDDPVIQYLQQIGAAVCSDIDLFLDDCTVPVIAVTGSNGKSTVVKLLHDMLSVSGHNCCMLGNIGKPVLSLFKEDQQIYDYVIVELSSFQLYWTQSMRAYIGVVLNIYPNHLDWHRSLDCYADAKLKLLKSADIVCCTQNVLDRYGDKLDDHKALHILPESISIADHDEARLKQMVDVSEFLRSPVLAARKVASLLHLSEEHQRTALQSFQPWPYRCQFEPSDKGSWYNDAKSTNLAAARYALESVYQKYHKKMIWIAGGVTKNEDFSQMTLWVDRYVNHAIVFGQDKDVFLDQLLGSIAVSPVDNLKQAIKLAIETMSHEDIVVFSPAAASFDQYENYMHRGQHFKELLQHLMIDSLV
ncbi:MAG: UDP-N-acetylmuramoyl-L-alanine--D-glutamate ligase [Pseudomonadota bacterium]|nr:UDP-N-acetylmuramoyl-L-alanine--D-glutamate ligase [Pseudomonadota bacterium]